MGFPTAIIGGEEWQALGLAAASEQQESPDLSFQDLLEIIGDSPVDPGQHLRLTLIQLEVLHDSDGALRQLRQAGEGSWPRSLLLQLALERSSRELLEDWTRHERQSGSNPAALIAFCRALLGDVEQQFEDLGSGPAANLISALLLGLTENWQAFATNTSDDSAVGRLLKAHILGDRLGQQERRAELLRGLATDEPVVAAELLLDMACRKLGGVDLNVALERRITTLGGPPAKPADSAPGSSDSAPPQPQPESPVPAAAAALFLRARGRAGSPPVPVLDDRLSAAAWRHLVNLVERSLLDGDPLLIYLDETRQRESPLLGQIARLRAMELLMARGDAESALQLVEDHGHEPGLVPNLLRRYRLICLGQLRDWDRLAVELLRESAEFEAPDQRTQLLAVAAVACMRSHTPARHLEGIRDLAERTAKPGPDFLTATLLAALRQIGDAPGRNAIWTAIEERGGDEQEATVASFVHGLLEIPQDDLQAINALEKDRAAVVPSPVTLGALAVAMSQSDQPAEAVGVLQMLAACLDVPGAGRALRAAAALALTRADDGATGWRLIQDVARRQPDDAEVLEEAAAITLRAGETFKTAELLSRAARLRMDRPDSAVDRARAADLLCASGTLLLRMGDGAAAEHSYHEALELQPTHLGSLEALRVLLASAGRLRDLAPVLRGMLEAAGELQRPRLLRDLATLHKELWEAGGAEDDANSCVAACDEALRFEPVDNAVVELLITVLGRLGRWQDLIERLANRSNSVIALRGLSRAYRETERWAELAEVSMRLAEVAVAPRESLAAALRAGDISWKYLGALERAADCYRWASKHSPDTEPLKRLAELHRQRGQTSELAATLEELLPLVRTAPEQLPLHLELGRLYQGTLAQPRTAIRHFEAAIERDSSNDEALSALAVLLADEKEYTDLARVLERQYQRAEGSPDELSVLMQLGDVYHELDDQRSLLRVAQRIHALHAADAKAATLAEGVYLSQSKFAELCELYERQLDACSVRASSEAETIALLRKKGRIELDQLGEKVAAAESFSRVLEIQPGDELAMAEVERILSELGDWQRLVGVFEKRADGLRWREEQVTSLHRAARIAAQQLKDEAETTRLYERIHALDPSDVESFTFLARKLERKNEYQLLSKLLVSRADQVEAPAEKVDCLRRAAVICESTDLQQAIDLYRRVLTIDSANLAALEALARIYESVEDWKQFLEVTRLQIQHEKKAATRALLHFKCGSVLEAKHLDEKSAERHYRRALRAHPSCLPALHSLRDLYSRRGDWPGVIQTLELEARVWGEKKDRADVLAQIAEIYATKMQDQRSALQYYHRAIEIHPENMPAALALFTALASNGNYAEAATWGEVYARQVQQRGTAEQQAEFYAHWGDVLRRIGRYQEAAKYLVWALELRPGRTLPLFSLLDLCHESPESYDFEKAFADLLNGFEKRGDDNANAILLTSCGVLAERRGDLDGALKLYRQAVESTAPQIRLLRPLADLLVLLGEYDEARQLIERCLSDEVFTEWLEAIQWLVDFEMIWNNNFQRAVELCRIVLEQQPNRDDIRLRLAKAELLLGNAEGAQADLERICEHLEYKGVDVLLLARRYHALGVAADRAGNFAVAQSSWRRARALAPHWPVPYAAQAQAYLHRGAIEAAERELVNAERAGIGNAPEVQRMQAAIQMRSGREDLAVEIHRRLSKRPEADAADHIQLARYLARRGSTSEAVALLKRTITQANGWHGAVEELEPIYAASGALNMASRAARVVGLSTEIPRPVQPALARGPLHQEYWIKLMEPLTGHPLDEAWRLLRGAVAPVMPSPATRVLSFLSMPEIQVASRQMATLFQMPLEIAVIPEPGFFVAYVENQLLVSSEVERVRSGDARFLLALIMTTIRAGYGALLGRTTQVKTEVGLHLAALLGAPGHLLPAMPELLTSLSRREQRQLAAAAARVTAAGTGAAELVHSWLTTQEAICLRVALLITDDLFSLVRVKALEAGIPYGWLEQPGLQVLVPDFDLIVEYYLSEDFDRQRHALGGE